MIKKAVSKNQMTELEKDPKHLPQNRYITHTPSASKIVKEKIQIPYTNFLELSTEHTGKERQITLNHMERYSVSLMVRKMQTKIVLRYFSPIKLAKNPNSTT